MNHQFIQVSGENLVFNGEKIILRGFGIGNWLNMEHFMTRMPGTDHQKRALFREIYGAEPANEFFESYVSNYITEQDFIFLKELGVNVVRLAFTYRHFENDQFPGEYCEAGFKHLDRVLRYCEKYGIYAIMDLHAVPGGQNPDTHADSDLGESKFWDDASFRNRMVGLWSFIADHYKNNQWVAAYDLLNEPVNVPDVKVFNDFFDRTIEAVRRVDNHHVIFLEGDHWAQDFSKFHQPQDPQIAYSFHFYPSFSLNPKAPESWSKNDLEKDLKPLLKIRDHFNRPLWCGETGAGFSKESILFKRNLLRDTLDILEANEVSWTLWAYKDAQAMGLVYPKQDTPWMRFVTAMNWRHSAEQEFASQVFNFLEESKHFQPIPESTRNRLRFRVRGVFHDLYLEQILKPKLTETPWAVLKELPASFLWNNCDYYPEIADLVRSYTMK